MRVIALTAAVFAATALISLARPALADGCGDACEDILPKHAVTHPVVHHAAHRAAHPRMAYYNYAASGAVREGFGHGEWQVAPNDGQVPMLADPCACAPAPMAYGPPVAYGPPPGYYGQEAHMDDKGWTGGVGYNAEGGGGGGGGFMDGFGQVHFANGGGTQNGPTYNDYNQSFQSNPSVPGAFVPQRMGVAAPVTTSK